MIGTGSVARLHLPAYGQFPERIQLAAVADIDERAARAFADKAEIRAIYTDPYEMIRRADIDAVEILSPNDQHAPQAMAAIVAGKHVLVEKPMACGMNDCRRMVAAANKAGVVLMAGQSQRYDPVHAGVRRMIHDGELGAIRAVRMDCMQHLPAFCRSDSFYFDARRAGGGVVISLAIHAIDLMRHLIGEVRRVTAISRRSHPAFAEGTEDFAAALLEFDNGALGELFATYSGVHMPWGEQYMIFGERGTVHAVPPFGQYSGPAWVARDAATGLDGWTGQYHGFAPVTPDHEGLPSDDKFVNEILHFAECCRTGSEPISSGRDNLKTMQVIFSIYRSAETGQAVDVAL
jgi:predicted dehydrogenase